MKSRKTTTVGAIILASVLVLAPVVGAQGQGKSNDSNGVPGRVAALEAAVAALQGASTSLQTTINALTAQIAALQNAITAQAAQIVALQNALTTEAANRAQGDAATLAAAKTYTDEAVATLGTRFVFATSAGFTGNLGGLAGADNACSTLAAAANLPGVYKAWLSDNTGSPSTRFDRPSATYKLVDGTVIAQGWEDLTDGTLNAAISLDENGQPTTAGNHFAWTNTTSAGTVFGVNSCSNWTSDNATPAFAAQVGNNQQTTASWSQGASSLCNGGPTGGRMLYCFQQ